MNPHIIYVYISYFMKLFVVEDECTYYLRLYILGFESFYRGR